MRKTHLLLLLLAAGCEKKEPAVLQVPANTIPPPPYLVANRDIPLEEMSEPMDDEDLPGGKRRKREGGEWEPAEFKKGASRWKDTGVYLDGKPIATLNFGELPVTLKPVWKEDEVSAPKRPGSNDPGFRVIKQRHYRFTEYLTSLGIDLRKIDELHVYGPNPMNVIVVSGKELREKGDAFLFRFGGEVEGKAIPVTPERFGNGKSPDKISGIMVYVTKKPPVLERNVGMVLDGKVIKDVPYYGEPLRGGVRVYFDDRLTAVVKRRLLDESPLKPVVEGESVRWNLFQFLAANHVDTSKIVEAWVIRDDRRRERLTADVLATMDFESSSHQSGQILLGKEKIPCAVLALHSSPVAADQLPQILPEEEL